MTLTQRLTRAGLTFIILGTAAAAMPQNDAAKATTVTGDCNGTTVAYILTPNSDGSGTATGQSLAPNTSVTLYSYYDIGGVYTKANAATTYTYSGQALPAFNPSGSSTTGTPTTAGTVTALIDANGSTQSVSYSIN